MRVIFLGRKPWACAALHELVRRRHEVLRVVAPSPADLVRERMTAGPHLHEVAAQYGLPVVSDQDLYGEINAAGSGTAGLNVDLVISFLFWRKILPPLVQLPARGCFNFHPAPLPEFRGRRGYNSAILEACRTYGASVHWVTDRFDEGDLVKVVKFPISADETALSLERKTMSTLLDLFAEFLDLAESGAALPAIPQGPGRSATKKEVMSLARVGPDDPPSLVDAKIRAFWYPPFSGAFVLIGGREYTLVSDRILEQVAADAQRNAEAAAGLPAKMRAASAKRLAAAGSLNRTTAVSSLARSSSDSGVGELSLRAAQIPTTGSLRDVLTALDRGALGIGLAVSPDGVLEGVLTDGDIRRALLGGAALEGPLDPFLRRQFIAVERHASRAAVLDLMQARHIAQVPVIDDKGCVVGLHTLHAILSREQLPNWTVVMAGGRGERLRPLTDSIPKPMVHVAGRPILERIVLHLVGSGVRRIFLAVNYKAEIIEAHFGDGSDFGCRIEYLREAAPLGTGGALALLPEVPPDPLVVLNGDLLTQVDVGRMLAFHNEKDHKATVGVHEYAHTIPFGVLDLRGERIVTLQEKPTHSWQTNAGIYILDPDLLARIPANVCFPVTALLQECLDRSELVGAFRVDDGWIDVGHHQELRRARGQGDQP